MTTPRPVFPSPMRNATVKATITGPNADCVAGVPRPEPATGDKRCTKCGQVKPLSDYYVKREHGRERLASHCKDCHRIVTRDWQATHRDKMRGLRRGYDARSPRTNRTEPFKQQAHQAVAHALQTGLLHKPSHCARCGTEEAIAHDGRSLLQAHHEDYDRPLDVEWLCASCHQRHHGALLREAS